MKKPMVVLFPVMVFLLPSALHAFFQDYATQRQKNDMNKAKVTSPSTIPGFQTAKPPEIRLSHSQALKTATETAFDTIEHAQTLKRISETRPYFVVDLEKDPLVKNSTESITNPEKVLTSDLHSRKPRTDYILKTCQEAKPPIEFQCSSTLLPPTVHIDPAIHRPGRYSYFHCRKKNHNDDAYTCDSRIYYSPRRTIDAEVNIPEAIHIIKEDWNSNCGVMDAETKKRTCKLVKQVCPNGPETREVVATYGPQRTPTSRQIERPCWRYEYTYVCSYPSPNTCEILRKSGCEQINSRCLKELEKVCVEWEQTYRCPTQTTEPLPLGAKPEEREKISRDAFPLPAINAPPALTPNLDMAEAIAKLSALKEIQDNMRQYNDKTDVNSIRIFKGTSNKCTIAFGEFKNCCTKGKGWGVSLHLSGCEKEDKDLAEQQKKHLCVKIGTYCATKKAGICLRKKKSYCCFATKLARLLHAQGRPQRGIGWGKPKRPECRGFTVKELSEINFDQLDLSELFSEITAKQITQTTVNVVSRNLTDRVSQMTKDFKPTFTAKGVKPNELNKPKSGDF